MLSVMTLSNWLSTLDIQPGNSFGNEGIFEIEWLSGMVGGHTVAGPACGANAGSRDTSRHIHQTVFV